jgi:hypothetical protein
MIHPVSHPTSILFYLDYMKTNSGNREQRRRRARGKEGPSPTYDLNYSDKYIRFLRLRRPKY